MVYKMPMPVQLAMGGFLGILWYDVFRIRRDVILSNLEIAFPEWTDAKKNKIGRQSCINLGRNFIEICRIPFISKENDGDSFEINGREFLDAAVKKDKGVFLLTLHLGNGDYGTAGSAINGIPMTIVTKDFKLKWVNTLWFGARAKLGTQFIAARNSSFAILKAIKNKAIIAFILDQFMGPPVGVKTTFFGRETGTAMGLAKMVQRSGAIVIPTYCHRKECGKTVICFEKEIPFVELDDNTKTVTHMTQVYNDKLEEFIRLHPDQWLWVHKRWKEFRD